MKNTNPIGIFDSGVGGLTVANAVHQLMPNESIVYFGDTAHLPYGEKSAEAIKNYSLNISKYLIEEKGAKAILIACNSASAVAYHAIKEKYGHLVPVFNVIDAVAQTVAKNKASQNVGVIGTRATISSNSYTNALKGWRKTMNIKPLATPLLVPVIEEGLAESKIASETINHYLNQKELSGIDTLILGCTHYPLMIDQFKSFYPKEINVVNSPAIVAEHVQASLAAKGLLNTSKQTPTFNFYISDYTPVFEKIAQHIFKSANLVEDNIWV